MTLASLALLLQEFGFNLTDRFSGLLPGVVDYAYWILFGIILASILFSWFPSYPSNPFFQAIYNIVRSVADPILMPIRSRIPMLRIGGFGLDLSPIIAIIGLGIARTVLKLIIANFIGPLVGEQGS